MDALTIVVDQDGSAVGCECNKETAEVAIVQPDFRDFGLLPTTGDDWDLLWVCDWDKADVPAVPMDDHERASRMPLPRTSVHGAWSKRGKGAVSVASGM